MATSNKQRLINRARYWHFNIYVSVSDNAKGWMIVLSYLEAKFDFSMDDYDSIEKSWSVILNHMKSLSDEEVEKCLNLFAKRR